MGGKRTTYVEEITDDATGETTVVEADTEDHLEEKVAEMLSGGSPDANSDE